MLERGVVHQDVELTVVADGVFDELVTGRTFGDVSGQQLAALPLLSHEVRRHLRVLLLGWQIVDRDVGAFAREQHGRRPADSRVATSNECDLAIQFS